MTTQEMLYFGGSVLGPALVAQALTDLLSVVPELATPPPPEDPVERMLLRAFPNGLEL